MTNSTSHKHRRSIRLPGFDYARCGAYFVTICTAHRQNLFGAVMDGTMVLNEAGEVAASCWTAIPSHFPIASVDAWVVMPNHVHGILLIETDGEVEHTAIPNGTTRTVGSIVRGFKIGVTNWFRKQSIGDAIWQRNYWERIVRDDTELDRVRTYVAHNPRNWSRDDLKASTRSLIS
jgi:REP element-mobilizing transposase RayT